MKNQESTMYVEQLKDHYENYFGISGQPLILEKGPREKLHPDFFVLEFKPNDRHDFWVYCSVGMSLEREDDNLIELFVFSPQQDSSLVELITVCASYHRNLRPLNIHHTMNIGKPWLGNSKCDHCFISLPYLDGEEMELFSFNRQIFHCYWLIPITEKERDYKIEEGCEALEQLFEDKQLDYLNPERECLLTE
ncbi:suppressor of fused domain protein [Flavobacterium endoglycinae]|uniref:Suppressor of fused domain protein n=1 Tax=Flavobacterium endoglycinae TaxID=2816357 RepID=A0ABX7QGR0_9FLAO|nr:suppressor of fused domain protein [Flavobacterium endoglycinae]QSW90275.1 suppressor of fused domain protein [Flavobacterium endoglycinae]